MILFLSLFFAGASFAASPKSCAQYLAPDDLRTTFVYSASPSATQKELFEKLLLELENGTATDERLIEGLTRLSPGAVARMLDYDLERFRAFYRAWLKGLKPDSVSRSFLTDPSRSEFLLLHSNEEWVRFLDPTTVKVLLSKAAKIAQLTQSPEVGIVLSSQFGVLLSAGSATEIGGLVDPMISKPTFLKSSIFFDRLPPATREKLKKAWGYTGPSQEDLVIPSDHFSTFDAYEHAGRYCGTCDDMPRTFAKAIRFKLDDVKSRSALLVKWGKEPVGLIKNMGDASFLSIRNVRNAKGQLILVKGGVYGTHAGIGDDFLATSVDLKSLPVSQRLFYPLTFMRNLKEAFNANDFDEFIRILDVASRNWKPQASSVRVAVPRYLFKWQAAQDKIAYLSGLSSSQTLRILAAKWEEIPQRERFVGRLNSTDLRVFLLHHWEKVANPESFLPNLEVDDRIEILVRKWSALKNPEQFREGLADYDFGRILSANWYRIRNPMQALDTIKEDWIREQVLRTKDLPRLH